MRKLIVIAAVLLVAGCQKENPNARQVGYTNAPRINVEQPTRGQVFRNNDIIMIDGTVVDDDLSMGLFEIRDNSDGTVYFTKKMFLGSNDNFHFVSNTNGRFHLAAPVKIPAGQHNVTLVIQVSDKEQHVSFARVPLRIETLPTPIEKTAEKTSMIHID